MTRCSAPGPMRLKSRCWLAVFSPGDSRVGESASVFIRVLGRTHFFLSVIELKSPLPFWLPVPRGHLHVLHIQSQ